MAQISLRVDDKLKQEATELYKEMGMDMTTAINLFLVKSVRTNSIPFRIDLSEVADEVAPKEFMTCVEGIPVLVKEVDEEHMKLYNSETLDAFKETEQMLKDGKLEISNEDVDSYIEKVLKGDA